VLCVYRRSRRESPARVEELEHAIEEGVEFHWLTSPVEILGNTEGWVTGLRCQRMELGEPDASGRRRPVAVEGSEFDLEVDTVIYALGTSANPVIAQTTPGLSTNKWGYIDVDEHTCATSLPGVFAGGDIVTGAATVILAMGAGRRAAKGMLAYMGIEE
jgi:glutamate synthase (NADPH/NADH) small chain